MCKITVFKTIDSDSQSQFFEIEEVFDRIRRGNNRHLIEQIRSEKNKAQRDFLKKKLFWICFSGKFSKRNNESLIEHSGYICLDFDGIPEKDIQFWRGKIQSNPHTFACFISPSGNGLKAIWKIPACKTNDEHNLRFDAIADTFTDCRYFDRNVKGWSRVCFESYDPQIFVNLNAEQFTGINEAPVIKTTIQPVPAKNTDVQRTFNNLVKWFESSHNLRKGNRNQGAFVFASGVAEYLTQSDAEPMLTNYIMQNVEQSDGDPFTHQECQTCIRQAYLHCPQPRKVMNAERTYDDTPNVSNDFAEGEEDQTLDEPEHEVFWSFTGRGAIRIEYLSFKLFLEENGFFKYRFNAEDISFIRIVNNIVSLVTVDNIRDFVLNYLHKRNEPLAYNAFAADSKFDKKYLAFLEVRTPKFIKDTKSESWVFYRNTAVLITAKEIKLVPYIDLTGYIWERQKIDRDFKIATYECDFSKFLMNVSNNKIERCQSLLSGLGYMMHRYKDPSTVKALIVNEEIITNEPEGGTGKGLIFQAMSKIRVVTFINGKNIDLTKDFAWQRVEPDNDIVAIDDPPKNFKFESLFSILTTGWPIRKLYKGEIYLLPEDSPKIGITTNYVMKGNTASHERRKFELEFYPYYNAEHQPIDDFKKSFWRDWDADEWNRFDNLMLGCIRLFLDKGLIKTEFVNLKMKKLMAETSPEFADFAHSHLQNNNRYNRNDTFAIFVKDNPGSYCKSANMFYDWMKEWAIYNGWAASDVGSGRMFIEYGEVSEPVEYDKELPF